MEKYPQKARIRLQYLLQQQAPQIGILNNEPSNAKKISAIFFFFSHLTLFICNVFNIHNTYSFLQQF